MADWVDRMQVMEAFATSEAWKILIKDVEWIKEAAINKLVQSLGNWASFDMVKSYIAELSIALQWLEKIESRKYLGLAMERLTEAFKQEWGF